jgi:dihydrolipoamide dehydrogenase
MYDIIIIGSGPAGHTAALEAAKNKLKTLLIEKEKSRMGGTCLNEGCIPLKGLLHHSLHDKDYHSIINRVMKRVEILREGLRSRITAAGIDIVEGAARFISENQIECSGTVYTAKIFIIASGSSPKRIFNQTNVYSPEKIFSFESVPGKALVIGGGVIGCEYASFLNNIGVAVDIAEVMPTILFGQDEEGVRTLSREFKKRKITLHEGCTIKKITESGKVTFDAAETEFSAVYDCIIEATGRMVNTASLNLESAGIAVDEKGFIPVNQFMATVNPNVYACGDCISSPMLAYTAVKEAETAVSHICGKNPSAIDYTKIPLLTFSSPQFGSVGINQSDAASTGIDYLIKKYYFKALGKSFVEEKDSGFIKLVIDKQKDSIIGAIVVGDEALEVINELSLIINCGITNEQILAAMHVHPSYNEIIGECIRYGI